MAELKQYKESEHKVHEQLYDNLFLLSQIYPTSKNFNANFKKDMFMKSNKTAFFEVIYYLLNILNPVLTKEKLTAWPPFEIKRENKFRSEVLSYINELNIFYDNADIPHIMASHLISPGGFKFAKFVLKLSQLVVYEHLKKTGELHILYCPKPSKNVNMTKANIRNLQRKTAVIDTETRTIVNKFKSYHFQANEKAISINNELAKLNHQIRDAKQKFTLVKGEFDKQYPSYPSLSNLEEEINLLKGKWDNLQEMQKLFKECERLVLYLNTNELVLDHKDDLNVPSKILNTMKNREELDLIELFQSLNTLLEGKALEWPNPTRSFITHNLEKINDLNENYTELNDKFSENLRGAEQTIEKLSRKFNFLVELTSGNEATDEILAVPLDDSDELK